MAWLQRVWRWLVTPPARPRPRVMTSEEGGAPPASLPLNGELDLHTFRPEEVSDLVGEYVRACRAAGQLELRIVHGKGKGVLQRTVHARLSRLPEVACFALAPPERGGWGATLVDLHPAGDEGVPEGDS